MSAPARHVGPRWERARQFVRAAGVHVYASRAATTRGRGRAARVRRPGATAPRLRTGGASASLAREGACRAGIARQHAANPATAPRQAAAIAYDDAIRLLALARQPRTSGRGIESATAADARGQRDAAIVSLLFCAGIPAAEESHRTLFPAFCSPPVRRPQRRAGATAHARTTQDPRTAARPYSDVQRRLRPIPGTMRLEPMNTG